MNGQKSSLVNSVVGLSMLLLLLGSVQAGLAQSVTLLTPLNTIRFKGNTAVLNDMIIVSGCNSSVNCELWKSDGTADGTSLLKDINPHVGLFPFLGSDPQHLTRVGEMVFFTAYHDSLGRELWKTDGTTAGTVLVKDIYPGDPQDPVWPENLINVQGTLYFTADDGIHGEELWKSDGTTAGTVMVVDLNPGPANGCGALATPVINGEFLFQGTNSTTAGLWKSDGTEEGTVLLKAIGARFWNPVGQSINGTVFFDGDDGVDGRELWKTDGTTSGTVMVKDINPGGNSSLSQLFLAAYYKNKFFFDANDGTHGTELWMSDGTENGTILVRDINPGASSSDPGLFKVNSAIANGFLLFPAFVPSTGLELWRTDGTADGTVLVENINPGADDSTPDTFIVLRDTLYFNAYDFMHADETWRSDGTPAGTELFIDLNPGPGSGSGPSIAMNGTLFLSGGNATVSGFWAVKSPISVTLTPNNPPIQIPPGGGSFQFDVTLQNSSAAQQPFDFWTFAILPKGTATDPLFGPVTRSFAPGQTVTTTLTQNVPPLASGTYTYIGNVGIAPDSVFASDNFTFTVTSSPGLAKASGPKSTGDWSVYETGTQPQTLTNTVPEEFSLAQNYPNPFNPTTTISYQLPQAERVKITIYDLTGREVRQLVNESQNAGSHQVQWNGTNGHNQKVASGLYLYRLQAGEFVQTRKMAFIK